MELSHSFVVARRLERAKVSDEILLFVSAALVIKRADNGSIQHFFEEGLLITVAATTACSRIGL